MAHNLKYSGTIESRSGDTILVEILEKDYVGADTSKTIMSDGVIVSTEGPDLRDVYKPLITSTAEVILWDPDGSFASDFDDVTDGSHHLRISKAGSVVFYGRVRPEPIAATLDQAPDGVLIQAVCGLVDLKNEAFLEDDRSFYTGDMQLKDIVLNSLNKLDLGLDCYFAMDWWIPGLGDPNGLEVQPMQWLHVDASTLIEENGNPVSCAAVLENLLPAFNLQLRQSEGAWHCVQRELLFSSYYRHCYTSNATLSSHGNFNPSVSTTEAFACEYREEEAVLAKMPGYRSVSVAHAHGPLPTLIRNADFSATLDSRTRGVRRGSINETQPGGRVSVGRRGVRNRNTGSFGPRFWGANTPGVDPIERVSFWYDQDNNPITTGVIKEGEGPNGENVVTMDPIRGSSSDPWDPVADIIAEGLYYYQDGLVVRGGTGRQLRSEVSLFVVPAEIVEGSPYAVPAIYDVRLTDIDNPSNQYWLTDQKDANGHHIWSATEEHCSLRRRINTRDRSNRTGAYVGSWQSDYKLSQEIPTGSWRVRVIVYPALDWLYSGASISRTIQDDGVYWTNLFHDVVVDGEYPDATIWTAIDPDSLNTSDYQIESIFGDLIVADGGGGLRGNTSSGSNTPTDNWKQGRYSFEPDSGVALTELNARSLYTQQSEVVPVHVARYHPDGPFVAPHEVLNLDGEVFQIGQVTYDYLTGVWGGRMPKVQISSAPPENNPQATDEALALLGGFGSNDARFFAIFGDSTYNTLLANPVATTTDFLVPGFATSAPVNIQAAISTGDELILIDPVTGQDYQFTATANSSTTDSTLYFDDDALLGIGVNILGTVDYPAPIYFRDGFVRSLIVQTENLIRAAIQAGTLATLNESIPSLEQRDEIEITPLRVDLKKGTQIILANADQPSFLTLSSRAKVGATELEIDTEWVQGAIGDAVVLDSASLGAELLIQAHQVWIAVRNARITDAIAALSAEASGASVTSLSVSSTKSFLKDGTSLRLEALDSEDTIVSVVNGDHNAGVSTINILTQNYGSATFPSGSPVRLTNYSLGAEIKVNADEIVLRAYEEAIFNTIKEQLSGQAIAVINDTGTKSGPWTISAAPEQIEDNTEVVVLVPVASFGGPATQKLYTPTETVVNGQVNSGATSITFDDSFTINSGQTPAYVLMREYYLNTRFLTNEASITVNATSITNLVAQYESDPTGEMALVATMNNTYSGSRSNIDITLEAGQTIEKYDTLLIWNKANANWYEVRATEQMTSSGNMDIENPTGGGSVTLVVDSGDPILFGTFSRMRQTLEGFTIHSRYWKTDNFNGTVTDAGEITSVGTQAGYALGGGGDFAFVKGANDYIYFDGTTLEIKLGGGNLTFDDDGLTLTAGTASANTIQWKDGSTIEGSIHTNASGFMVLHAEGDLTLEAGGSTPNIVLDQSSGDIDINPFATSNVNIHSGVLFVDANTDRVGVNDTTPSYDLDVSGTINATTYRVGGTIGADYSGTTPSSITIVKGIVTSVTP